MKSAYKLIIGIIIGVIISSTCIAVAKSMYSSENVTYSNGQGSSDVKSSLDELYERAGYTKDEYKETLLNGADPVLGNGMIPVYIDGDGTVYYANKHTAWYSYEAKRWANAVILVDKAKNTYKPGDEIKEEDIESYFVWIPRYAYKIWNLAKTDGVISGSTLTDTSYANSTSLATNNARIIDIKFGSTKNLKEDNNSIKKLTWNSSDGTFSEPDGIKEGDYLIHPGFTLGGTELNGLWVGKFETGGNADGIVIQPDVDSWRSTNIKTFFQTSLNYKNNLNSHMMKNTEWGAAAYLSHSAYGKGSQVNINNAWDYKTGYSAAPDTDQSSYKGTLGKSTDNTKTLLWNTATGYLASTTGNITGVYDMSGGAYEMVAATMINNGSKITGDKSGFEASQITTYMQQGYIDAYPNDSNETSYSKRILGDATGEMGPFYSYKDKDDATRYHNSWYADGSSFVNATYPWFTRGNNFEAGVQAGQFTFARYTGDTGGGMGFRLVLAVI